ncbi:MaoC/PaaZ C-terminal domain-containing protein [Ruegeria sp. ANG10]|uniref:MaoC/PaaZ C-terminal domain-containing protein n=1 Tax=Ruegeria sp. ANG10 TaxID=3042467 RepID=UPI0034521FFB
MTENFAFNYAFPMISSKYFDNLSVGDPIETGGIIASGFQSIALTFRLFRDTGVLTGTNLGGHGMDEVRWLAPVFPGDTLCARIGVEVLTPSRSKPDRGTVRLRYRTFNQDDVEVVKSAMHHVMARREQVVSSSYCQG